MTEATERKLTRAQWLIVAAILLSAFIGLTVRILSQVSLNGTALLYIGVPTIIALAVARMSPARSIVGSTLKAITFVILISGPLLQEGFICMVMAAPILYLVGGLVAWPFDRYREKQRREEEASKLNVCVLPVLLLMMSMEGVVEETSFKRHHAATHTRVIDAGTDTIERRLGANRPLGSPQSPLAKLFPLPDSLHAEGLMPGDRHEANLRYVKWIYWNETRGSVRFEVAAREPGYIRFKLLSDDSYLASYLTWGDSEVFLEPVTAERTRVTWRINYRRNLDPAWYMQPLQSYMTNVAAELLVESLQ